MENIKIFEKLYFPILATRRAKIVHIFTLFISTTTFLTIYNPFLSSETKNDIFQTLTNSIFISFLFCSIATATIYIFSKRINSARFKIYDYVAMIFINVFVASIIFSIGSTNIMDYIDSYISLSTIIFIPYFVTSLFSVIRYLIRELRTKKIELVQTTVNKAPTMIDFIDEYGNSAFYLDRDSILYIAANDNYVNIHCWVGDKVISKSLRSSMKALEEQLKTHNIVRCHRSYMVNVSKISFLNKEKGKHKLELNKGSFLVPVSASFVPEIKSIITI